MSKRWSLLVALVLVLGCNDAPEEDDVVLPDPPPEGPGPGETVYTLDQDLTWSSDTVISGVWYVAAGVTLRIEAGVQVSLLPGTGLIVDGILDLAGTADEPVRFVNAATLSVGNFGISVGGAGDLSSLDNASFTGVSLYLEGEAAASITGSSFSDASLYVRSRTVPFLVDSCSFSDGQRDWQTGLVGSDLKRLDVAGSTFARLFRGIQFDGSGKSPTLSVTGSSFDELRSAVLSGLGGIPHAVVIDSVTVTNTSFSGMEFFFADATVSNSSVTDSLWHGIQADRASTLTVRDSSIVRADASCISAQGGLNVDTVSVSACRDVGIWAGDDGAVIADSSVDDVGSYGIRSEGVLSVEGTTVQNTGRTGIYVTDGSLSVSDSVVSASRSYGVYCYDGDIVMSGTTVTGTEEAGVFTQYGSITISDSTISDVRSYGLRSYHGNIVVEAGTTGVEVSGVDGDAVWAQQGNLTATALTVDDVGGIGIRCDGGNLTLSDSTVTSSDSHGIYVVDGDASISVDDGPVVITSAGGRGVLVQAGNLSADGIVVTDSFSSGINVINGQGLISNCTIEGAGADGIGGSQSPILSVSGCAISGSYNHGVSLSSGGSLVVASTDVTGSGLHGIYGYRASVQATDSTLSGSGQNGVYVYDGSLSLSSVVVANSGQNGVYVYDGSLSLSSVVVANSVTNGIYTVLGDTSINQCQIVDQSLAGDQPSAGGSGILALLGTVTISDTLVDKAVGIGVNMTSGTIVASTISNGGHTGVNLSGHDVSSISSSNITGNAFRGIQSISFGLNLTDITGNNITGNGERAVVYAQTVDGNYIADNHGFAGADTGAGGTLDGVRDTSSDQIYAVDVLSGAASAPVAGTGPTSL
jgi:hypothetical protein